MTLRACYMFAALMMVSHWHQYRTLAEHSGPLSHGIGSVDSLHWRHVYSSETSSHNYLCHRRSIERPSLKNELNPSIHGVGETSYMNPLGRRSISRPSAQQLERASIVHIMD